MTAARRAPTVAHKHAAHRVRSNIAVHSKRESIGRRGLFRSIRLTERHLARMKVVP